MDVRLLANVYNPKLISGVPVFRFDAVEIMFFVALLMTSMRRSMPAACAVASLVCD